MTTAASHDHAVTPAHSPSAGGDRTNQRAQALADRLELGARALAAFASGLTDGEWNTRIPGDGRTVGVVVHHVASVYPVEIQLAQTLAAGQPIVGVTMDDVHAMNAAHARDYNAVTKETALNLLRGNSTAAAAAIRALERRRTQSRRSSLPLLRCAGDLSVRPRGSRRCDTVTTTSRGCEPRVEGVNPTGCRAAAHAGARSSRWSSQPACMGARGGWAARRRSTARSIPASPPASGWQPS